MILRGDFFSKLLDMNTGLTVVGPHDFSPGEPYTVCYLLHGMCGNSGDWTSFTQLPLFARKHRTVFVMPEVSRSFYTDMARGQKFFSYVTEELPQVCRAVFNVSSQREDTMVIGVSMGGYGALKCALRHPERYGRVAAFAPGCLYLREDLDTLRSPVGRAQAAEVFGEQLPVDFMSIFGDDLAWRPENDIVELARAAAAAGTGPAMFLACGESDYLIESCRRFHGVLEVMPYPHVYEEWPGEHSWYFFNEALGKALAWAYGE